MSFSLAPLLVHGDYLPPRARKALRAAVAAPAEERAPLLKTAASILHREAALDCADALELVALPSGCGCQP